MEGSIQLGSKPDSKVVPILGSRPDLVDGASLSVGLSGEELLAKLRHF